MEVVAFKDTTGAVQPPGTAETEDVCALGGGADDIMDGTKAGAFMFGTKAGAFTFNETADNPEVTEDSAEMSPCGV